jgi:MGT family glycosyltransferase
MARVLFCNGPQEGHVNPTIGLVKELVKRGEEVNYFTTEEQRNKLEQTGAVVHTYPNLFKGGIPKGNPHYFHLISLMLQSALEIVPSILEQEKHTPFDYIIHDSMFGAGNLAAKLLKLPSINSHTGFVIREGMFEKMLKKRGEAAEPEEVKQLEAQCSALLEKLNDRYELGLQSYFDLFSDASQFSIIYTSRYFQPREEMFSEERYKFIGPSIVKRAQMHDFPIERLNGQKVLFISLGTVFNRAASFYKQCIEAFGDRDLLVVMSVGYNVSIQELGELPSNFIVKHYVPQLEVLQHTHIFLTHGGMNSVNEGLYYGVPLILYPQNADQPANAHRVEELGAGMKLQQENISAGYLWKTVEQMMNSYETFHKNVEAVQLSFKQAGGLHMAAEEIFSFKQKNGIS